jgi:hypothetical protein
MLVWPSFCAACGQGLRREDKFCANCGVPVPQQPFESAGTMVKPAWSEEKSTHQIVQPEALHRPARAPIADEPSLFPEEELKPAEPLPVAAEPEAAEPETAEPETAEPVPSLEEPEPAEVPRPEESGDRPAGFRRVPTAFDRVPPLPTAYDRLPRPIPLKPAPQPKARLPVLEILVILLLLVGAIIAVWMLRSSQPAKPVPAPANVAVTLLPATARVSPGHAVDFAATVSGTEDVEVDWSVQEGDAGGRVVPRGAKASGGKISALAVYIAPDSPGTYHLVATSKADSEKSATAEITVKAGKAR